MSSLENLNRMPPVKLGRSIGWNLDMQGMKITQRIYDGCDCYPWMEVRAWWPIKTISGKYIWGRKVYKRKFWAVWGDGFHMEPEVEYAELFEILHNGHNKN